MHEIKCPHCNKTFTVNESDFEEIKAQIKNQIIEEQVQLRLKAETNKAEIEIAKLKAESEQQKFELQSKIASLEADKKQNDLIMKSEVDKAISEKEAEISKLKASALIASKEAELKEKNLTDSYEIKLKMKDEQINYYKDFKSKMSTKMVGESLEQYCLTEFNKIRMSAFPTAYFEKDNDDSLGSKGDFIYRENTSEGGELISIMFEMKNEMDTTATKHKNEDFFKKLDEDRKKKNCEYAVLVSLLEADNEFYNAGIVDVSYRYEKMYVIRPQCFIPMITLLRNAALKSADIKNELVRIQNENIDVTNFEEKLLTFQNHFNDHYEKAKSKYDAAIEQIDKTIANLQKVKESLVSSEKNFRLANADIQDITIKKLTRNNPTMKAKFDELKK
jgi:hypothetical protein